jgi:hypothetical protein
MPSLLERLARGSPRSPAALVKEEPMKVLKGTNQLCGSEEG